MRQFLFITITSVTFVIALLMWQTYASLEPFLKELSLVGTDVHKAQILDRHAHPLTITYQNDWNVHDYKVLHEIPEKLQHIFIVAEDKRFFKHSGPDWTARWHAMQQNLTAMRIVRGASTMTEQTVRMLHPRPRTFWSRWVEGFEAVRLEQQFSKADILEFYLNQVPYARQLRGVVQAARFYFDRDLDTLNLKEMLALAVLVRAPTRLDLKRGTIEIEKPLIRLAKKLVELDMLTLEEYQTILNTPLKLNDFKLPLRATHFVNHIYASQPTQYLQQLGRLQTTLDSDTQYTVQKILDQRLLDLKSKNVNYGSVLVVDHRTNEILAWVNSGTFVKEIPNSEIDAVTTPRQPGSTLKPFLYALALEKGWTAATLIDDSPLAEAVGTGLHNYRNYSRSYYGSLSLRDSLGNSLNIPAIRTVQFVGAREFLQKLRDLGMGSLTERPDYYGDGLALGNGGITLFELVQAYTVLANRGVYCPLKSLLNNPLSYSRQLFSPEVTSLIANILSDPSARRLEFGSGALLRFPVQTAVKTGTSTDYHDAWAIGFNHHYTIGVWLGNLDQRPMSQVSGSSGAALVLRAIFAELTRYEETEPLYLSPKLIKVTVCRDTGKRVVFQQNQEDSTDCPTRTEWFLPGTEPATDKLMTEHKIEMPLHLQQPSNGLQLAMDPRIPDDKEVFVFRLSETMKPTDFIEWLVDGEVVGTSQKKVFLWPLQRGTHLAQARVWHGNTENPLETPEVTFYVK